MVENFPFGLLCSERASSSFTVIGVPAVIEAYIPLNLLWRVLGRMLRCSWSVFTFGLKVSLSVYLYSAVVIMVAAAMHLAQGFVYLLL